MSPSSAAGPRWNEVTAIFGGRFDPPHLGHREAVRGLFQNPGVKQVFILPSASPAHKPTFAPASDRAKMAAMTFQSTYPAPLPAEIQMDLRELERGKLQPEHPTYSFETLQELRQTEKNLAFVIGTDQAEGLPTWHRFPEILGLCHWIVLERKPQGAERVQKALQPWVESGLLQVCGDRLWQIRKKSENQFGSKLNSSTFILSVPTEAPAVSSTEIREVISRTGKAPANGLLPDVIGYLKLRRLYGIQESDI